MNPLELGFRLAVSPGFDTRHFVNPGTMKTPRTLEQWAARYDVSRRTVCRMKRSGVRLDDPAAVAMWLAQSRTAHPGALARIIEILDGLPTC